jgi:hypothetical protein
MTHFAPVKLGWSFQDGAPPMTASSRHNVSLSFEAINLERSSPVECADNCESMEIELALSNTEATLRGYTPLHNRGKRLGHNFDVPERDRVALLTEQFE